MQEGGRGSSEQAAQRGANGIRRGKRKHYLGLSLGKEGGIPGGKRIRNRLYHVQRGYNVSHGTVGKRSKGEGNYFEEFLHGNWGQTGGRVSE